MNFYAFSGLLTFVTSLGFSIFSWIKGSKRLNKIWAVFCFCVAIWGLGCFKFSTLRDTEQVFLWLRIGHVGVILMPAFFLHFILEFLELKKQKTLLFAYGLGIVFSAINFTDALKYTGLLIAHLRFVFNEFYVDSPPARLYPTFLCYYFGTITYAHYCAFKEYRHSSALKKNQMKYFLFATILGFSGGATSFLMVFGIDVYPSLHITVPLYPVIMTYAIVNYKLMDIEVIIRKTLVFAGLSSFIFSIFAIVTFIAKEILSRYIVVGSTLINTTSIILAVVCYEPLRNFLINFTDRYLFQKKVNYRLLLKEATEYLAYLDSLKRQARRIVAFLLVKARIANASVYTSDSADPSVLKLKASRPCLRDEKHKSIHLTHPAAHYMQRHKGPIDLNVIYEALKTEKDPTAKEELTEIIRLLNEHKAEAAIPCFSGDAALRATRGERYLKGILFLGHQKSDEPYTEEDLDVFFTLGQESSIAFENARLYDEAVERTEELQKINLELQKAQDDLVGAVEAAERSEKQAIAAKKKTEEMELELIRREKLLFVEKLVKGIAHEIFNPMTPIRYKLDEMERVYIELFLLFDDLKQNMVMEEKKRFFSCFKTLKEDIEAIKLGNNHIKSVIDTLTQLQQKDSQILKPFDLKTFWKVAHPMLMMESHGESLAEIPIEYDVPNDLPLVIGNATQLTQVVINFFRNAQHAMNGCADKKITVVCDHDPNDRNFVRVRFSDKGSGIPADILPKIFDFQFTTKGEKGQGIGLNQCKLIIEKFFKGGIECQSEVGKGTTFIVRLPVWKGDQRAD